jgi:hypothetical protein
MTTGSSPVAGHWVKRGGRLGGRRESGRWGRPLSGPFGQRHVILRWSGCGDRIWRRVGTRARLIEGTVGTALRLLVRSATPSVWDFVAAGGVGGKEGFEPQRHRGHRVVTESVFIPFCDLLCASVPLCLCASVVQCFLLRSAATLGGGNNRRSAAVARRPQSGFVHQCNAIAWGQGGPVAGAAATVQNGSTGSSPMKKPRIWRTSSRVRRNQSQVLSSFLSCS